MISLRQGFGGRVPILAALLLASCDLGTPLPASAQLVSGPAMATGGGSGATATAGDCSSTYLSPTLTTTCTKTNGVAFGSGATSAAPVYPGSACQAWQALQYTGGAWTCAQQSGLEFLAGRASAVNMNVTGDTAIALTGPTTGLWVAVRAMITNCSAVNTSFQAAFYTGAAGTGSTFLGSGALSYGASSGATTSTFSRVASQYTTPNSSNWQLAFNNMASGTAYFRVTTVAGSAQACDVSIYAQVV